MDSFSSHINRTYATLDVDIYQGSITTFINSSSFEIISKPELRTLLLQWNNLLTNYKEAETLQIQFTVDEFFPYMDEKIPIPYHRGIIDNRIDLSFLGSVKFENLIKRRRKLINSMLYISRIEGSHLLKTINQIIDLSTQNE